MSLNVSFQQSMNVRLGWKTVQQTNLLPELLTQFRRFFNQLKIQQRWTSLI